MSIFSVDSSVASLEFPHPNPGQIFFFPVKYLVYHTYHLWKKLQTPHFLDSKKSIDFWQVLKAGNLILSCKEGSPISLHTLGLNQKQTVIEAHPILFIICLFKNILVFNTWCDICSVINSREFKVLGGCNGWAVYTIPTMYL